MFLKKFYKLFSNFQNPHRYKDKINYVKKLLAFLKVDRSLKITVPLPMSNSS